MRIRKMEICVSGQEDAVLEWPANAGFCRLPRETEKLLPDAAFFALYGEDWKPGTEVCVTMDFEVRGEQWRISRRRAAVGSTRTEVYLTGPDHCEKNGEADVNPAVTELLGCDGSAVRLLYAPAPGMILSNPDLWERWKRMPGERFRSDTENSRIIETAWQRLIGLKMKIQEQICLQRFDTETEAMYLSRDADRLMEKLAEDEKSCRMKIAGLDEEIRKMKIQAANEGSRLEKTHLRERSLRQARDKTAELEATLRILRTKESALDKARERLKETGLIEEEIRRIQESMRGLEARDELREELRTERDMLRQISGREETCERHLSLLNEKIGIARNALEKYDDITETLPALRKALAECKRRGKRLRERQRKMEECGKTDIARQLSDRINGEIVRYRLLNQKITLCGERAAQQKTLDFLQGQIQMEEIRREEAILDRKAAETRIQAGRERLEEMEAALPEAAGADAMRERCRALEKRIIRMTEEVRQSETECRFYTAKAERVKQELNGLRAVPEDREEQNSVEIRRSLDDVERQLYVLEKEKAEEKERQRKLERVQLSLRLLIAGYRQKRAELELLQRFFESKDPDVWEELVGNEVQRREEYLKQYYPEFEKEGPAVLNYRTAISRVAGLSDAYRLIWPECENGILFIAGGIDQPYDSDIWKKIQMLVALFPESKGTAIIPGPTGIGFPEIQRIPPENKPEVRCFR